MSNQENQVDVKQASVSQEKSTADYESSPGTQLTNAREAMGLTQKQVADRLHLRLNSVQAVENDALEEGVSVTFTKGYVRLYAKLVHLEAQPLLEAYDKMHKQSNQPAKLQSFSRRVSREAHDHRWNMVTIVVVLLVLGSVIGWWVQQSDSFDDSQSFVTDTFDSLFSESENAQNADIQNNATQENSTKPISINDNANSDLLNINSQAPEETLNETGSSSNLRSREIYNDNTQDDTQNITQDSAQQGTYGLENSSAEMSDNNISSPRDTELNNASNMLGEVSEQNSDVDNAVSSYFSADSGLMVNDDGTVDMAFTFLDDCWVSIKNVDGEVIAIGVKAKGRVMQVSGLPPIQVILGAPQNVEINFGGNDIDMSAYPDGRSAKFTLPVESE